MNINGGQIDQQKFNEIQTLLQDVYKDGRTASFEVNETTVSVLHQVLLKLKTKKRINKELIHYYNSTASSYAEQSMKLNNSLEATGISLANLPPVYQDVTKALADSTCILNLEEPSTLNFALAFNKLSNDGHKISEEKKKILRQQALITKRLDALIAKTVSLEMDLMSLKDQRESQSVEMARKNKKLDFLHAKAEEYTKKAKELEDKFKSSGFAPDVSHKALIQKNKEIMKLEEKLNALSTQLNGYHNLPPDENLAKLKVEEMSAELYNLEQEIQRLIA